MIAMVKGILMEKGEGEAIVGYGKAEKQQIQQMVKLLLHMDTIAKPDDAADAIAIALTHAAAGPARVQFRMK